MNLRLDGKKALVTVSTAGIGVAIARALAREGASVVIMAALSSGLITQLKVSGRKSTTPRSAGSPPILQRRNNSRSRLLRNIDVREKSVNMRAWKRLDNPGLVVPRRIVHKIGSECLYGLSGTLTAPYGMFA